MNKIQTFSAATVAFCFIINCFFFVLGTHAFKGTFTLKVPRMIGTVYSETFYMKNIPWRILIKLTAKTPTHLGVHLQCDDENDFFEHKVNSTLQLISLIDKSHDILRDGPTDVYRADKFTWGWDKLVSYNDLNNPKKGLIRNGAIRIILDAHFDE